MWLVHRPQAPFAGPLLTSATDLIPSPIWQLAGAKGSSPSGFPQSELSRVSRCPSRPFHLPPRPTYDGGSAGTPHWHSLLPSSLSGSTRMLGSAVAADCPGLPSLYPHGAHPYGTYEPYRVWWMRCNGAAGDTRPPIRGKASCGLEGVRGSGVVECANMTYIVQPAG